MKNKLVAALALGAAVCSLAGCSPAAKPGAPSETGTIARDGGQSESGAEMDHGAGSSSADGEPDNRHYTVGIGQFAVHGSLDNCREGFIQGLSEEGLVEGENVTILYENANADGAASSQIAANFLSNKTDLICAIATPMAQSAYSATRKAGFRLSIPQ